MAKYVEILFRRPVEFLALLLLLPIVITAGVLVLFRPYQAYAALWVEKPTYFGDAAGATGWNYYATPAQNLSDRFTQIIQTGSFQSKLGDALSQSGTLTDKELGKIMARLDQHLTVEASGSHLIYVTFNCDRSPVCLKGVSSSLDLIYDRLALIQQNQAELAKIELTNQLRVAEERVRGARQGLEKYLADHPGITAANPGKPVAPELDVLLRQVDQGTSRVDDLNARLLDVAQSKDETARFAANIATVVDPPQMSQIGFISLKSALRRAALVWLGCLAAAAAYLVLLARLDRTARDPRELESRLQVPVLVTIPQFAQMEKV